MADISELIGRLEKLTGPDREMDLDLAEALFDDGNPGWWAARRRRFHESHMLTDAAPPYTASLDAAIALVERLLPGWGWTTGKTPDGMAMAGLRRPTPRGPAPERGVDRLDGNVAIALLIAALKAKGGVE